MSKEVNLTFYRTPTGYKCICAQDHPHARPKVLLITPGMNFTDLMKKIFLCDSFSQLNVNKLN